MDRVARFWSFVEKRDGCWPWAAKTDKRGRGQFKMGGKLILANRLAYQLTFGNIPAGLCVCHTCDNPNCCNPEHLFLGTPTDNQRDCILKGRKVQSKLTPEDVRYIRISTETQAALAVRFHIARSTISEIRSGKRYRYY